MCRLRSNGVQGERLSNESERPRPTPVPLRGAQDPSPLTPPSLPAHCSTNLTGAGGAIGLIFLKRQRVKDTLTPVSKANVKIMSPSDNLCYQARQQDMLNKLVFKCFFQLQVLGLIIALPNA